MLELVDHPVRVRVPATSANLGPGFDCAGLALSLYDDVEVSLTAEPDQVVVEGEGSDTLPRSGRHLLIRAARAAFGVMGEQPRGLKALCHNRIPQSRGLGSSSAVLCAGVLAARALVRDGLALLSDDAVLALATELEGHPDNVAACLRGGATFAWGDPVRVLRVQASPLLAPVAFVPPTRSSTKATRGLLPASIPFADAAANAGRAALLSQAVADHPELLLDATADWLHQPYRASAMPASADLVAALRADGLAGTISGAGPTVLALVLETEVDRAASYAPEGWDCLRLAVDADGAQVLPASSPAPSGARGSR